MAEPWPNHGRTWAEVMSLSSTLLCWQNYQEEQKTVKEVYEQVQRLFQVQCTMI